MKSPGFGFALALIIAFTAGCSHTARQSATERHVSRPKAFALAVTVKGGLQPTPMQWAAIQAQFVDEFAWRGWVLVTNLALADYIVRVDFTPDPADPENNGRAQIVAIRESPRHILGPLNTLTAYPTSFVSTGTFRSALSSTFAASFASPSYFGWSHSLYHGFSYSSPTLTTAAPPAEPPAPKPPYRHPPRDPARVDDCPPHAGAPTWQPIARLPGDFAPRPSLRPNTEEAAAVGGGNRRRWTHRSSERSPAHSSSNSSHASGASFSPSSSAASASSSSYSSSSHSSSSSDSSGGGSYRSSGSSDGAYSGARAIQTQPN